MRKLIERFFSLFIHKSKMDALKKEASNELRGELLDYQNKVYFNKLRKRCR